MNLTPTQLREYADAIEASHAGRQVEYLGTDGQWKAETSASRQWGNAARRPAPLPVTRGWNKPEDVPLNCWMRFANSTWGDTLIIGIRERGIHVANTDIKPGITCLRWDEFTQTAKYSTDRLTWHPCTTTAP